MYVSKNSRIENTNYSRTFALLNFMFNVVMYACVDHNLAHIWNLLLFAVVTHSQWAAPCDFLRPKHPLTQRAPAWVRPIELNMACVGAFFSFSLFDF